MNAQRVRNRKVGRRPVGHTMRFTLALGLVLALAAGVARGSSTAVTAVPGNTSLPTISGTAQQGQTLIATTGAWSGSPTGFGFQWQRCDTAGLTCGAIAGATGGTRVVEAGDVGGTLRVVVTASNAEGSTPATSAQTAVVAGLTTPPTITQQPNPQGLAQVGQTISVENGAWTGTAPITFSYQWQRCLPNGTNCLDIAGATGKSFLLTAADVNWSLRSLVRGTNSAGTAAIYSNRTATVANVGTPVNTVAPLIANRTALAAGLTATGAVGTWIGDQPISFAYTWNKCDPAGKGCVAIPGANQPTYFIPAASVGGTLVLTVRATNNRGATNANSAATAVIKASGLPIGAVRLASGRISIPASSVALPARLVISDVKFSPTVLRSRNTFTARFRVTDTRGYLVRDALVYTIGLPYSRVRGIAETRTGADGYAVMNITPTGNLPLKRGGAIVFFVRARKAGDNVLAGVSTRRLVQVTVSR